MGPRHIATRAYAPSNGAELPHSPLSAAEDGGGGGGVPPVRRRAEVSELLLGPGRGLGPRDRSFGLGLPARLSSLSLVYLAKVAWFIHPLDVL